MPSVTLEGPAGPPRETLTRAQAGTALGLSPNTVGKLLASAFLPDLSVARVAALARAPRARVTRGELPVLRATPATAPGREGDDRQFIGDAAGLSDDQFLEASRQWWRCEPDKVVGAGVLAVSMAGWVTGVLAVHRAEATLRLPGEVRHAFAATVAGRVGTLDAPGSYRVLTDEPALADLTRRLLGTRVHAAVSGGPIAYLRAPAHAHDTAAYDTTPCHQPPAHDRKSP
ncbi:DNA-binding protein [Streptomyces sp. PmtG]